MASTASTGKVKLRVAPLVALARQNLKKTLPSRSVRAIFYIPANKKKSRNSELEENFT